MQALRYSTLFATDPSAAVKEFALKCVRSGNHPDTHRAGMVIDGLVPSWLVEGLDQLLEDTLECNGRQSTHLGASRMLPAPSGRLKKQKPASD